MSIQVEDKTEIEWGHCVDWGRVNEAGVCWCHRNDGLTRRVALVVRQKPGKYRLSCYPDWRLVGAQDGLSLRSAVRKAYRFIRFNNDVYLWGGQELQS